MSKKINFIVLGIVLVGMLVYLVSTSTQLEKPPVAVDKPALPASRQAFTDRSVTEEQPPPEVNPATQKSAQFSADGTVSTSEVPTAQQHAPELEPEIREALGNILNTSSEGLVEETHNGVTSVDLQGRFQTAPVAAIDEDGNVQITDYSHLPKASPPQ